MMADAIYGIDLGWTWEGLDKSKQGFDVQSANWCNVYSCLLLLPTSCPPSILKNMLSVRCESSYVGRFCQSV